MIFSNLLSVPFNSRISRSRVFVFSSIIFACKNKFKDSERIGQFISNSYTTSTNSRVVYDGIQEVILLRQGDFADGD